MHFVGKQHLECSGGSSRKNGPLLTVCMITYNHEKYIRRAIDSVLSQRVNFQFNICLGEDDSDDGTRIICVEYANKYPDKIRLLLGTRSEVVYIEGRPSGIRNFCKVIDAAEGEYIAFLEGDDYWSDPDKLQRQMDFLQANSDCSMVGHLWLVDYGSRFEISHLKFPSRPWRYSITDFISGSYLHIGSIVSRRPKTQLPNYMRRLYAGDFGFWLWIASNGDCAVMPFSGLVYTVHSSGAWSSLNRARQIRSALYDLSQISSSYPSLQTDFNARKKRYIYEYRRLKLMAPFYALRKMCARFVKIFKF
jgi:glycosyltransferase involved in cell wall biosynthesis